MKYLFIIFLLLLITSCDNVTSVVPTKCDNECSEKGISCVGNDVYNCGLGSDGCLDSFLIKSCVIGEEVCRLGECIDDNPSICTANEKKCSGNNLEICNSNGSAWDITACDSNATCTNNNACICNDDYEGDGESCIPIIDQCVDVDCTNKPNTVCEKSSGDCICKADFHKDIDETSATYGECVSNIKEVDCLDPEIDYSTVVEGKVDITWNIDGGAWNLASKCEWTCEGMYELNGDGTGCAVIEVCLNENNPCTDTNKTICTDDNGDGTAECSCDLGYALVDSSDLDSACENIDDCTPDLCQNGGSCIDGINAYTCDCTGTGFDGDNCQNNINDCANTPCLNGGECIDAVKGYSCNCDDTGFEGANCENDVNECASNTDNCDDNATCTNIDNGGGFSCVCNTGYTGGGESCEDKCTANNMLCDDSEPCTNNDCSAGVCLNTNKTNGITCNDENGCTDGDTCNEGACGGSNIDCSGVEDQCNDSTCTSTGDVSYTCDKVAVSNGASCTDAYSCTSSDICTNGNCNGSLDTGWVIDSNNTCKDFDECINSNDNDCDGSTFATCFNIINGGGYYCGCVSGWSLDGDGLSCTCDTQDELTETCDGLDNNCNGDVDEKPDLICNGVGDHSICIDSKCSFIGVSKIYAGKDHSCLITDGTPELYCWGDNGDNRVTVDDDNSLISTPVKINLGSWVPIQASLGDKHTCVVVRPETSASTDGSDHEVVCWGNNDDGQLGINSTDEPNDTLIHAIEYKETGMPPYYNRTMLNVGKVTVGAKHSCALLNSGKVFCWGKNDFGQIGNDSNTNHFETARQVKYYDTSGVLNSVKFIINAMYLSLSSGESHNCVVLSDDSDGNLRTPMCWGRNDKGQLGVANGGGNGEIHYAVNVLDSDGNRINQYRGTVSGKKYSCAVSVIGENNNKTVCWGENDKGAFSSSLGDYTHVIDYTTANLKFINVSAFSKYLCYIDLNTNEFKCQGDNDQDQINTGADPAPLSVMTDMSSDINTSGYNKNSFMIGEKHTCYLSKDPINKIRNVIRCKGEGDKSQLGDNTTNNSPTFVYVKKP